MAGAGSHHLGAGVRAQASRQQPGLWGRGELGEHEEGQGPLGTAGATPEGAFNARDASRGMYEAESRGMYEVKQYGDFSATQRQDQKSMTQMS